MTLKKVSLDGIDYDAAPEVANALNKAIARADKAEADLAKANEALKTNTDEAEKAKAQLDAAKEEVKTLKEKGSNTDEIQKAVKDRMALERVATKVITGDKAKNIDAMADLDLMKEVILAKSPKANLDGQTDVYIRARFDAVAEGIGTQTTAADQRRAMNEDGKGTNGDDTVNLDQKATDAFQALKDMSKPKEAK